MSTKMSKITLFLVLALVIVAMPAVSCGPSATPTKAPAPTQQPTATGTAVAASAPTATVVPMPTTGLFPTTAPTALPTATLTSAPTPTSAPKPEGMLRIGVNTTFGGFDPVLTTVTGKSILALAHGYLVGVTPDGTDLSAQTGLADKWDVAPDGLSWTFHLRKGVQFQDGWGEATADDVKFSVERVMGPRSVSPYVASFREVIKEVQVVDPYNVKFVLNHSQLSLAFDLSRMLGTEGIIVPKKYIQQVGEDKYGQSPIGIGPYKVVEQKTNDHVTFQAISNYWLGTPKYQTIVVQIVPEQSTLIAMLKRGELDVIPLSADSVKDVKAAGFPIFLKDGSQLLGLYFSNQWDKTTALSNLTFRKAVGAAINKEEIVNTIFKDIGKVTGSFFIGTWTPGYQPLKPIAYNTDEAKRLLKEAGYNGEVISIAALTVPGRPELPTYMQAVAGYLEAVGIKTKVVPMDWAAFRPMVAKGATPNWIWVYPVPNKQFQTSSLSAMWQSKGALHFVEDPTLDGYIAQLQKAPTLDEATKLVTTIQKYVYDQVVTLGVAELGEAWAANSSKVKSWNVGGRIGQDPAFDQIAVIS